MAQAQKERHDTATPEALPAFADLGGKILSIIAKQEQPPPVAKGLGIPEEKMREKRAGEGMSPQIRGQVTNFIKGELEKDRMFDTGPRFGESEDRYLRRTQPKKWLQGEGTHLQHMIESSIRDKNLGVNEKSNEISGYFDNFKKGLRLEENNPSLSPAEKQDVRDIIARIDSTRDRILEILKDSQRNESDKQKAINPEFVKLKMALGMASEAEIVSSLGQGVAEAVPKRI